MSKRVQPIAGYEAPAGSVVDIVESKGASRALRVIFQCRHCHLLGETRWTKFRRGEVKSCGCLSKKAFFAYHQRKAENFENHTKLRIFEKVEEFGSQKAGKIFGISSYVARFVWLNVVQRLAARADAAAIGMAAIESGSYVQVAKHYGVSVWAVNALAGIKKRQLKGERDPQLEREYALDTEEFERLTPEHQVLWGRLQEALALLEKAEYTRQNARFGDRWDWRPPGEYSSSELHKGSKIWTLRSDLWHIEMSRLPSRLQSSAVRFSHAVDLTLKNRRERYRREASRRFRHSRKHEAIMLGMELAEPIAA